MTMRLRTRGVLGNGRHPGIVPDYCQISTSLRMYAYDPEDVLEDSDGVTTT